MEGLLSQRIAKLESSATEEVDNIVKKMQQGGIKDIVSLGAGEPCFPCCFLNRMEGYFKEISR